MNTSLLKKPAPNCVDFVTLKALGKWIYDTDGLYIPEEVIERVYIKDSESTKEGYLLFFDTKVMCVVNSDFEFNEIPMTNKSWMTFEEVNDDFNWKLKVQMPLQKLGLLCSKYDSTGKVIINHINGFKDRPSHSVAFLATMYEKASVAPRENPRCIFHVTEEVHSLLRNVKDLMSSGDSDSMNDAWFYYLNEISDDHSSFYNL